MRRIMTPQRDAVGRLARREFPQISTEMAYRFRDVYDHVVRLTDEAFLFQDRVTGHPGDESGRGVEPPQSDHEGA
jgi:Mg2+ and Co2+ transporter CorA